ncbi:uncharacterized protein LOC130669630 [Microplitis mediator]|uniref:uncharacterized protein LOC130669630 n=1 Tax=Microplitis mediator TaxID=375433 RepID=UPI0025579D3B|nr:uncharacterized protein LOC130669630 [Microplitis mediator]
MNLIKYIILCSLYVHVIVCDKIKILGSSKLSNRSISHTHTLQLLELCFPDRMNPVAVSSNLTDIIYGIKKNKQTNSSVLVIDENLFISNRRSFMEGTKTFIGHNSYPSYILSADSLDVLENILTDIDQWDPWNSERVVFAVGKQCSDALATLKCLWSSRMVSSYFTCPNGFNNDTIVYTFNPYADRAPKPWRKVNAPDKPPDPWTLYRMSFVNDKKTCASVNFDKTAYIDNYKLQMWYNYIAFNRTNLFYQVILSAINITPIDYVIFRKTYDTIFVTDPQNINEVSYRDENIIPFYLQGGYIIITQKQNTIPTLSQVVADFFTSQNIIMSSVILVLIFGMILLNNKYHFGAAVLDLLALILNMRMMTPIDKLTMRITFLSATLFILIFNPVLQGQLVSVLTRPGHKNIETLKDLRDNNYHIYFGYSPEIDRELRSSNLWEDESFEKYVHHLSEAEYPHCLENVRNNASIACIIDYSELDHIYLDTHVSSKDFARRLNVFTTNRNWALNKRVKKIALKLMETGFLNYFEKRDLYINFMKKRKIVERIKKLTKYNQLDLEDSALAYIAIALSTVWALIVFGTEFMIRRIELHSYKRSQELEMKKSIIRERIATTVSRIIYLDQQV